MTALEKGITANGTGYGGKSWNILGQVYFPKAVTESTFAFETNSEPGQFVPVHIHPTQDEFILVQEGTLDLKLDGKWVKAHAGDLVQGRDAHDFGRVGQIVELGEQRLQLLHRRDPEQRAGRFVGFVEIAVRDTARQAHEVAGMGLDPFAVELEVERAFLHQDEFVLGRMDVHRHELAGIAVGLERKGRVRHRLGEVDLSENIPGLAGIPRSVLRNAFFESGHDSSPHSGWPTLQAGRFLSSWRGRSVSGVERRLLLQKLEV